MNNWDSRPLIVVGVAGANLPAELLDLAVKAIVKDEGMTGEVTKECSNNTEYYLMASGGLQPDHIDIAMGCLFDHIENVDATEACNLWVGCINEEHVDNKDTDCECEQPDCIEVSVSTFTYYGQGVSVEVYYIDK